MNPIKCWIAQDGEKISNNSTYFYLHEPVEKDGYFYHAKNLIHHHYASFFIGKNLFGKTECKECVIITKEEYNELKNGK